MLWKFVALHKSIIQCFILLSSIRPHNELQWGVTNYNCPYVSSTNQCTRFTYRHALTGYSSNTLTIYILFVFKKYYLSFLFYIYFSLECDYLYFFFERVTIYILIIFLTLIFYYFLIFNCLSMYFYFLF